VAEAKKGKDVQRYRDVWECIRIAAPDEPEATFDQAWADQTDKANKKKTNDLEVQLKGYKNNLVKESIRVCLQRVNHVSQHGAITKRHVGRSPRLTPSPP
jgi:hypothetical protein